MQFKYATKDQLIKINKRAIEKNYNRAVEPKFLESLDPNLFFPVCLELPHEHAQGKPVELHMRCMFVLNERPDRVLIDVEMGMYEMLDTYKSPENKYAETYPFSAN